MNNKNTKAKPAGGMILTDGSRLITEALARAGADIFIGYPITPANLLYQYSLNRFDSFLAAPDEITTMQWMCGFSASGKFPVTATAFPGFALMLESVNMAYMMELPMLIVLVQRLGPSTGTATAGAQGDLALVNGTISGGYAIPTFSISNTTDCWDMAVKAMETAVSLRSPVILLTSKEELMTLLTLDPTILKPVERISRTHYQGKGPFLPYEPDEKLIPSFLSLDNPDHQVRYTASTHNKEGILQNKTPEALANTRRLHDKAVLNMDTYFQCDYDEQEGADTLLVAWGITARSATEATRTIREQGNKLSLLNLKTLLPVSDRVYEIMDKYNRVFIAEENYTGQYRQIMFGSKGPAKVKGINAVGEMISPRQIMEEITYE